MLKFLLIILLIPITLGSIILFNKGAALLGTAEQECDSILRTPQTELKLALCLRNKVYSKSNFVDESHPFGEIDDWSKPDEMLSRAYSTNEGHLCGGRVLLYLRELQKVGMVARYAGILEHAENSCIYTDRSHASVEVYISGQWVALDPHFNISFRNQGGDMLGWKEIYNRSSKGELVLITTDGYQQNNYLNTKNLMRTHPLQEVAKYLIIGPSKLSRDVESYPKDWDGLITYRKCEKPQQRIDVVGKDEEYKQLESFDVKASIGSTTYLKLIP